MKDYDVIAAHGLKHHYVHSLRGIMNSGLRTLAVVPFIVESALARRLMRRRKALEHYQFKEFCREAIQPLFRDYIFIILRALNPNLATKAFDARCVRWIASGRITAEYWHFYQDYMPKASRQVVNMRKSLISEQISNSSLRVRKIAAELGAQWNIRIDEMGFGDSEEGNDQILRSASGVICGCEFVAADLRERCRCNPTVIPYGVDVSLFRPNEKSDLREELRIVARANSPRKGIFAAVDGLAKLINGRIFKQWGGKLVVDFVGNMQIPDSVRARWKELLGNPNLLISFGQRPPAEMASLLAKADIFLMPALSEGRSMAALEAAASGACLLITNACGVDEFRPDVHGRLLRKIDGAEVAGNLEFCLENPSFVVSANAAAAKMAKNRTWLDFERDMAVFYKKQRDDVDG